jgi:3-oxoacyl-(acyl-carrier-protein) synthase
VRRAFLVEPFRPADVVPGLKTRRLDRLSVWSLVAASLAIRDAGLDLDAIDRARFAIVCATGLGCIELTEAYFQSAADHGWAQTDPIIFPETLGNAPASHVARVLDLRGPNITIGSSRAAAECAIQQATLLLRHRQADLALVLAGDTLTRTAYEWYEAAGMLERGFVPSEGVAAVVLEPSNTGRQAEIGGAGLRPATSAFLPTYGAAFQAAHAGTTAGMAVQEARSTVNPVAAGLPATGGLFRLIVELP